MLGETASASSTSIPGVPRCDIDVDAVRAARSDFCQLADRVLEPAPTQPRITVTDVDHVALVVVEVQQGFDDAESWGPRNNPERESNIAELIAAWRDGARDRWCSYATTRGSSEPLLVSARPRPLRTTSKRPRGRSGAAALRLKRESPCATGARAQRLCRCRVRRLQASHRLVLAADLRSPRASMASKSMSR
jgi:hypothetical protein